MNPEVEKSRHLRQAVLRVLHIHRQSGLEIGYTADELANLNVDSIFGKDPAAIGMALRDLLEDGLVSRVEDCEPPRYVLTGNGADFCLASFPWARVDPYTGKQRA